MEKKCNEKLNEQRVQYDQIFNELTSDLEMLTSHLVNVPPDGQNLLKDTEQFEDSVRDLENQNDRLQRTIQTYESQLSASEEDIKLITITADELRRQVSDLQLQLLAKEAHIDELSQVRTETSEILEMQRRLCKCLENKDDRDVLSLQLQEMHQLLSQKSAETVRNTVALRWKSLEMSRMEQLAGDEKHRLNGEVTQLTKLVSEVNSKVMYLESQIEKKDLEIDKLTQRLFEEKDKESRLHEELTTKTEVITSMERNEYKWDWVNVSEVVLN